MNNCNSQKKDCTRPSKHKVVHYLNKAIFVMLFLITTSILVLSYFLFIDGNGIVTYQDKPFQTNKYEYYPGDTIFLTFYKCRYRMMEATLSYQLVDSYIVTFPETASMTTGIGCTVFNTKAITIPDFVDEGNYVLKGRITYKVNFIRDITMFFESNEFRIVRR